ncbi:MAG: hypothetical protein HOW73_27605 [Polyangiaceae bacterium]|nr:hypothetical protein [Polyangiaceae bacterium]
MGFAPPFRTRARRLTLAGPFVSCALVAFEAEAEAAPIRASLSVYREVGAETCVEGSELVPMVEAVVGEPILSGTDPKPVHLDVHIRRDGDGYVGLIELSGARNGSRTITDSGPGCDVLSQGLAVTIAVLLDGKSKDELDPTAPEPERFYDLKAPEPTPPVKLLPFTLAVGAFYDFGTIDGSNGGVTASIEAVIPIVSFGLTFITLPHAPRDRPEPHVYRFFAGRARVCTREPYLELFGASACAGVLAGNRHVERTYAEQDPDENRVERFDLDDDDDGAFLAAVVMIEVSRRIAGPVGMYADMGLSIPFFREPIDIPDVGVSYPEEEAVTFQMSTGFRFWFEE